MLQLYAAHALSRSGGGGGSGGDGGRSVVEEVVQRLLAADEESWDTLLGEAASSEVGGDAVPGLQLELHGKSCGKSDRGHFSPRAASRTVLRGSNDSELGGRRHRGGAYAAVSPSMKLFPQYPAGTA